MIREVAGSADELGGLRRGPSLPSYKGINPLERFLLRIVADWDTAAGGQVGSGRHLWDLDDAVRDGIPLEPVLYTHAFPLDRNIEEDSVSGSV